MTILRLRPGVRATPLPDGLHLRGWRSTVSLTGSPSLGPIWSAIEPLLTRGATPEALAGLSDRAAVRSAIEVLVEQLRRHDLIVATAQGPPSDGWEEWLLASTTAPDTAQRRLSGVSVAVAGRAGTPLVDALAVALDDCGLDHDPIAAPPADGDHDVALLTIADDALAVGIGSSYGYVTVVGAPTRAAADAAEIGAALRARHQPPPPGSAGRGSSRSNGRPTGILPAEAAGRLPALLAGAAVHRLVAARAGQPDPRGDQVLVGLSEPLRLSHQRWRSGEPLHDLLSDDHLGAIALTTPPGLAQFPVSLSVARHRGDPSRPTVGAAIGTGAARREAVRRSLELALALDLGPDAAVGFDQREARGIALRRAAHRAMVDSDVAHVHSQWPAAARRWHRALTVHFGVPATVRLRPFGAVWHADVQPADGAGGTSWWAVEADAGNAIGLAAMAAVAAIQYGRFAGDSPILSLAGGASGQSSHADDDGTPSTPPEGDVQAALLTALGGRIEAVSPGPGADRRVARLTAGRLSILVWRP